MAKAAAASTKLRPLGDRVVVLPTPREEMTKSGIVLPDTAQEKPQEAEVVSLGTGGKDDNGKDIEFTVKAGDKVHFGEVELDVLHCPGHTPGHIVFFHEGGFLCLPSRLQRLVGHTARAQRAENGRSLRFVGAGACGRSRA